MSFYASLKIRTRRVSDTVARTDEELAHDESYYKDWVARRFFPQPSDVADSYRRQHVDVDYGYLNN